MCDIDCVCVCVCVRVRVLGKPLVNIKCLWHSVEVSSLDVVTFDIISLLKPLIYPLI